MQVVNLEIVGVSASVDKGESMDNKESSKMNVDIEFNNEQQSSLQSNENHSYQSYMMVRQLFKNKKINEQHKLIISLYVSVSLYIIVFLISNQFLLQSFFESTKLNLQLSTYPELMNDYYTKNLYNSLQFIEETFNLSTLAPVNKQ